MITRAPHEETELIERILNRERAVVALPERHPLARDETVTPRKLDRQTLVALRRELAPRSYDAARATLRRHAVTPGEVRHASSPSEALALVGAGLGIYRVPASAAVPHAGVVYRELEGVWVKTVLMRRPEPPSPAVATVIALIEDLFDDAESASKDAFGGLIVNAAGP
jgi:DNA-binding transcriptional LysR family regulator